MKVLYKLHESLHIQTSPLCYPSLSEVLVRRIVALSSSGFGTGDRRAISPDLSGHAEAEYLSLQIAARKRPPALTPMWFKRSPSPYAQAHQSVSE
eukprot:3914424-Amphidinium_carterae.2